MIAAVRVRGPVDVDEDIENTLQTLGLDTRNQAVILEEKDTTMGMLKKVKDYVTYGEVDSEVLDAEEGETVSLSPPSGGFADTKQNTGQGGALGHRQDMDELLRRMR